MLRALRAGADGFLLKDSPPPDILRAIRLVAAGEPMLSSAVTRRLIARLTDADATARRDHANRLLARLTEREREVAAAIAQGKPNAQIGAELYMSVATVKAHVTQVLIKLELDNRDGGYRATMAHALVYERASRPEPAKLATNLALRQIVQDDLRRRLSPEQIAGQLRRRFPDEPEMSLSAETIYRSLYVQSTPSPTSSTSGRASALTSPPRPSSSQSCCCNDRSKSADGLCDVPRPPRF